MAGALLQPGICVDCKEPSVLSKVRCYKCMNRRNKRARLDYQNKLKIGQCVTCKEKATAGAFCFKHWLKNIGHSYKLGNKEGIILLGELWDAQNGHCAITKVKLIPGHNASLDHIIPLSKGGTNERANLRWILLSINRAKADMTDQELLEMCQLVVRAQGNGNLLQLLPKLVIGGT